MSAEIDGDDLAALLDADTDASTESITVVDIRSKRAFKRGHIPGSRNIPFPELATRAAELTDADRIVTVCPHGVSSQRAADLLASTDEVPTIPIESLRGGLQAWEGAIETGPADGAAASSDEGPAHGTAAETGPDAPF